MHRAQSKYKEHDRITWFGTGGTVAYVDYVSASESWFIGGDGNGGFKVIPPAALEAAGEPERRGFTEFDDAIDFALARADASSR